MQDLELHEVISAFVGSKLAGVRIGYTCIELEFFARSIGLWRLSLGGAMRCIEDAPQWPEPDFDALSAAVETPTCVARFNYAGYISSLLVGVEVTDFAMRDNGAIELRMDSWGFLAWNDDPDLLDSHWDLQHAEDARTPVWRMLAIG